MTASAQDMEVAAQLEVSYLAWMQKNWAADQKRVKSILKAWGMNGR